MIRARQPAALSGLPLGRMHPDTRPTGTPATREPCPRCGCKLSRYADAWERYCAPCQRVLLTEGQLVLPEFTAEWESSAETARRAATTTYLRCTKCDKPLAKRRASAAPQTGLCLTCHNAKLAAEKAARDAAQGCADCGAPLRRTSYNRAARAGRVARCLACHIKQRAA